MDMSAATNPQPAGNHPGEPMAEDQAADWAWENNVVLYCSVCFQPISSRLSGNGASPWLTSCGHITCAMHIFLSGGED